MSHPRGTDSDQLAADLIVSNLGNYDNGPGQADIVKP